LLVFSITDRRSFEEIRRLVTLFACQLVERTGATVAGLAFVIELGFLGGAEKIDGYDYVSLLQY
jgi:hypothetical protein